MTMSQQPQMNMAAMGGQVGGPVGGAGIGTPSNSSNQENINKLNTAIYDYLLRSEHYSVARELQKHVDIEIRQPKQSPNQRGGQQANGVEDGMDMDSQDAGLMKRPDDLPLPASFGAPGVDGSFLQDWWSQFWEIQQAHRNKGRTGSTSAYLSFQRGQQQSRMAMMGNIAQANAASMRNFNPMMQQATNPNGDLKRQAMANRNMTPQQMVAMQNMNAAKMNGQMMGANNQMERSNSQMDNRTSSPGSGDAPSPKRQRTEGGMQQMNQGRPGQPGQMQQASQVYSASMTRQAEAKMRGLINQDSNVSKGIPPNMGPGGQGSPALSQQGMDGPSGEFYAANGGRGMPMQGAAAGAATGQNSGNGNHALQDYQMQLMLLEQQNKKRLLMARQEQDNMAGGHPGGVGTNAAFAPGTSPSGSQRGGPSPNPNEIPRGSPGPGMMDPNSIPPQMRNQMMMGGAPSGMRPPSSHPAGPLTPQQMEMMRQQGMQMPNGGQFAPGQGPQGQLMPGQPGGQPGQGPQGTPRNTNMPPPPAPQTNNGTGPSSPQQAAPPTPSTAPKAKGGTKKANQTKNTAKKNAANATPATEAEQPGPPTPTPTVPVTPTNPNNPFGSKAPQMPNGQPLQNHLPQQVPPPNGNGAPQNDPMEPFGNLQFGDNPGDGLDPAFFDGGDALDTFDFDSFLTNDDTDTFGDFAAAFGGDTLGGIEGTN